MKARKEYLADSGGISLTLTVVATVCCFFSIANAHTIESDILKVSLDDKFPSVIQYFYKPNDAIMHGQARNLSEVVINGKTYKPEVVIKKAAKKAEYTLTFDKIAVILYVQIQTEGNIVEFDVTNISENGKEKVYTIEFPGHNLLSVSSNENNAHLTANRIAGGDIFTAIDNSAGNTGPVETSYVILNNDKLAGTLTNNTLDEWVRLKYQISDKEGSKKCSVWNNKWIYREIDSEIVELPFSKVIITDDANKDGMVDWQDGGIAYRKIARQMQGSEKMRNSISHIAINFASVTQWPFLRMLDNVKKLSLYTDNFGQLLLIKGYQSEGHDSAHPDYGNNFNEKAGGVKDFNILCKEAKKYNTDIGVHINQTEAYPEAKTYTNEMVTESKGWKWIDQSYRIDRKADIIAGNLYARLADMKQASPDLSFVYVDVYNGKNWVEWKLGEKLYDFGWAVWTEFHPHLDNYYTWTHQNAGRSKIGRFLMNHQKDTFGYDKLLKGYYHRGFMGWDDRGYEHNINEVIKTFMTLNLPTKYMQNFELLKWQDDYARFSEGLTVKLESGKVNMYKDDRLIASGDSIFIPWDPVNEEKIYHWNPDGSSSEWQLPVSWQRLPEVVLYELTDLGRVFAAKLKVSNGKVKIPAKALSPYVIYKKIVKQKQVEWGYGSLVKNPGFDSHSLEPWNIKRPWTNKNISIKNTSYGQTYLNIEGDSETIISQKVKGLLPGATYAASVWLQIQGQRPAGIMVSNYGGGTVEKKINKTIIPNNFPNTDKNGSYYQNLEILFDMPDDSTSATLSLITGKTSDGSVVMFDDVRLVPAKRTDQKGHYYFEDFENLRGGWGPFFYGYNGPCQTHISELHAGYTNDTISGRYSLKSLDENSSGSILKTVRSVLSLKPNSSYTLSFDYIVDTSEQFKVVVDKPFVDTFKFDKKYATPGSGDPSGWETVKGSAELSKSTGNFLVHKVSGEALSIDNKCPQTANGQISVVLQASSSGRCGIVVRYSAENKFGFIGYDTGSKWVWCSGDGQWGTLTNSGPNISSDSSPHTLKVRFIGKYVRVWVDGEEIFAGLLQAFPLSTGKTGVRNWYGSSAKYKNFTLDYADNDIKEELAESKPSMEVMLVDTNGKAAKFKGVFKTHSSEDTFISIEKLRRGKGMIVIDNFTVDTGS